MLKKNVSVRENVIQFVDEQKRTYMSVVADSSIVGSSLTASGGSLHEGGQSNVFSEVHDVVGPDTEVETGEMLEDRVLSNLDIIFIVYLSLIFILACLSNTAILLVFFRKSSLRTTSNRFVIQLLFVNLLCCCMLVPLVLIETVFSSVPGQCILSESLSCWISSLSVLSTLLIGGDQYLAVKFPLRYRHHVTRTRAYISQVTVVVTSTSLAVVWTLLPPPNSFWYSCQPAPSSRFEISVFLVTFFSALISYLLPVVFLTIIYCKIFTEAHNNSARTRRSSINPVENLYSLTSTLIAPLTISQGDSRQNSRNSSVRGSQNDQAKKKFTNGSASPVNRSESGIERKSSSLYRSPSHIKSNMHLLRHRISNASQIMQREEGKTARLYTLSLTSILLCWSPYYLTCLIRAVPQVPALPRWCLHLVMSPCLLYPLISSFIFASRNSKIKKELKRIFQVGRSVDELGGLPPPPRERRLGRSMSMSMKDSSMNGRSTFKESQQQDTVLFID